MLSLRMVDAEGDQMKIDCVSLPWLVRVRLVKGVIDCVPCETSLWVCKKLAQGFLACHKVVSYTFLKPDHSLGKSRGVILAGAAFTKYTDVGLSNLLLES